MGGELSVRRDEVKPEKQCWDKTLLICRHVDWKQHCTWRFGGYICHQSWVFFGHVFRNDAGLVLCHAVNNIHLITSLEKTQASLCIASVYEKRVTYWGHGTALFWNATAVTDTCLPVLGISIQRGTYSRWWVSPPPGLFDSSWQDGIC